MTKGSFINHLKRHEDIIDINKALEEFEDKLKENNLEYKNVLSVFTYNKENTIEYSFATSPNADIKIICKKL